MDAINKLVGQYAGAIPLPQIQPLNFTAPNMGDISSKWQEFLNRASNDPDIVNYYNNLLKQAQGDTNLAVSMLEKNYQTKTRQTTENLQANLQNLGLTFGQEQNTLENNLNNRGIALTQNGQGGTTYAGGGQAATELGNLNESQQLRQEAEKRSASQFIENAGLTRQKGITSAGQQLQQYGQGLQQQKQTDILNRANTYYNAYQNQQYANYQNQAYKQNQTPSIDKSAINPATGKQYAINPSSGVWDDNYFSQTYG